VTSPDAPSPTSVSFGGVSNGLLDFYVSTAGVEAAMNLAFNLEGGAGSTVGLSLSGVTPTEGLSQTSVLSEATSGSVAQVTSLLSLEGSALDLAATLLTVSLVSVESESGSSAGAATGAAPGAGQASVQGQGSMQSQGNALGESEEDLNPEAGAGPGSAPTPGDRPPIWERISLGLERAWEKARAMIMEDEGRTPAAEKPKATVPPPTSRKLAPPISTHERPRTENGTGGQAKPTTASDDASVLHRPPMEASFMQRPQDTGAAVDAALGVMGADRQVDGPSSRSGMELWGEFAQAQSLERAQRLVAMVASATVVSAGWTLGEKGIQRRSISVRLRRIISIGEQGGPLGFDS
jgi:hypothetical protein